MIFLTMVINHYKIEKIEENEIREESRDTNIVDERVIIKVLDY